MRVNWFAAIPVKGHYPMLFDALCWEAIDLPRTMRLATIGFSKYPENTIMELTWFSPDRISDA
jgi:hypothetical protein